MATIAFAKRWFGLLSSYDRVLSFSKPELQACPFAFFVLQQYHKALSEGRPGPDAPELTHLLWCTLSAAISMQDLYKLVEVPFDYILREFVSDIETPPSGADLALTRGYFASALDQTFKTVCEGLDGHEDDLMQLYNNYAASVQDIKKEVKPTDLDLARHWFKSTINTAFIAALIPTSMLSGFVLRLFQGHVTDAVWTSSKAWPCLLMVTTTEKLQDIVKQWFEDDHAGIDPDEVVKTQRMFLRVLRDTIEDVSDNILDYADDLVAMHQATLVKTFKRSADPAQIALVASLKGIEMVADYEPQMENVD